MVRNILQAAVIGWSWCALPAIPTAARAGDEPPWEFVRLTEDGHFKQRPAWSPDGQWLVFARHRGAGIFLYVRAADGSQERRLTDRTDPEFDAVWSPDGKRLAFAFDKTSPNQGDLEVYTVAADGTELHAAAVTEGALSHEEWPAWSPDGQWLAHTSTRDGNQELFVARPDGSQRRRLTNHPALDAHPAWSPDGKTIAFATDRWGDLELALIDVETLHVTRLTQSAGLDDYPAWSPDGRTIAFTSNRDRNLEIYAIDADGRNPRNLTNTPSLDNFPAWTPGGELTFVSNRDGGFEVYLRRRAAETER